MKIKIEYEVELPDIRHSENELEDFIRFETGDNGRIKSSNPFLGESLEPIFGTLFWEQID
jgi:hypothetical protein